MYKIILLAIWLTGPLQHHTQTIAVFSDMDQPYATVDEDYSNNLNLCSSLKDEENRREKHLPSPKVHYQCDTVNYSWDDYQLYKADFYGMQIHP